MGVHAKNAQVLIIKSYATLPSRPLRALHCARCVKPSHPKTKYNTNTPTKTVIPCAAVASVKLR